MHRINQGKAYRLTVAWSLPCYSRMHYAWHLCLFALLLSCFYCLPVVARPVLPPIAAATHQHHVAPNPIKTTTLAASSVRLPTPEPLSLHKKHLSLREAVLLALRFNPNILDTELDMTTYKFGLEIAQNQFLPQFSLGANTSTDDFHHFSSGVSATSTLTTPLGTRFSLGYDQTNFKGQYDSSFAITQPLLQGAGSAYNKIGLESAKDGLITQHLSYRDQISGIIVQVVQAYRSLIQAYQQLSDKGQDVVVNQRNLKIAEIKYHAGRISRNDLLQSKQVYVSTQYAQTQLQQQVFTQYQDFLRLLGLDPASELSIDKKFIYRTEKIPTYKQAVAIALEHNATYIAAELEVKDARRGIIQAKNDLKWQLDLSNTTDLEHRPGEALSSENTTGLTLSVPIRDIGARQAWDYAKIRLTKAQRGLQQAKLELRKELTSDLQKIRYDQQSIVQAKQALASQQRVMQGVLLQWRYGRLSNIDFSTQQATLTQSQVNALDAESSYLNDVTNLYQYLGLILHRWHIKLRY